MRVCKMVSTILQLLTLFHLVSSRQNKNKDVVTSMSKDYPSWPNPGKWNGTFSFPDKNLSGNLTFCYDGDKLKFAKYFSFGSDNSLLGLIFDDKIEYSICFGPSDCATGASAKTCTKSNLPQFPFPSNQFENYTYISQFTRVDNNNNGNIYNKNSSDNKMDLWVGNNIGYGEGYFGTNEYFDSSTGNIIGNVLIQEPGWVTEIRWFDTVWNGYDSSCFQIPDYCNEQS